VCIIELTKGQFLDIHFEDLENVSLEMYFQMIEGKTCSLMSVAMQIGAFLGEAGGDEIEGFRECGRMLGKAFQVQDDWLGIWGDNETLGKSTESDLLERKKSYPIISGLAKKKEFFRVWNSTQAITSEMIPDLIYALEKDGVKEETERLCEELYQQTSVFWKD
jgi:geranylgeranyl pyrophosphate synthase